MGTYEFSSVQINITGLLRQQLLREAMRIKSKDLYFDGNMYGRESNPHITVKYGIHTTYPTEIKPLFRGIDEIEVEFGEISLFQTSNDYDVVKISIVDRNNLRKLNRRISTGVKCTDTFSQYNPHATIAYVKKGTGDTYIGKSIVTGKSLKTTKVMFSGHEGNEVILDLGYTDSDSDSCIGVDFDGTLAKYTEWKGYKHLGDPVPAMVNKVKEWLKKGQNVKIFTARYSGPDRERVLPLLKKWCEKAGLPVLEVTNEKTPGMTEIWDDRARQVIRNRGITKSGYEFSNL